MSTKHTPADLVAQINEIIHAWEILWDEMSEKDIAGISLEDLKYDLAVYMDLDNQINKAVAIVRDLRNKKRTVRTRMWDKGQRTRKGVYARYGNDSREYDQFGGTRVSDRKYKKTPQKKAANKTATKTDTTTATETKTDATTATTNTETKAAENTSE